MRGVEPWERAAAEASRNWDATEQRFTPMRVGRSSEELNNGPARAPKRKRVKGVR